MSVTQTARPPNKLLTLLFVLRSEPSLQVLLGYKKRGFAQGRWNGFGGKVQPDENIEDAAVRETKEECGLDVTNLDKVGVLKFEFVNEPQILEVHVFRTTQFSGVVSESEEMRPQWFNLSDIPYDEMWPDDKLWYPKMFNDKYFDGYFKFEGMSTILEHNIIEKNPDNLVSAMSVTQTARPPNKLLTLLFVLRSDPSLQVLLGYKKRGFAQGRWTVFGGKVQPDESIEDAAVRETKEECGLDVTNLDKVGVLKFEFVNEPQILEAHVFRTTQFSGVVSESEEMRPQWFNLSDIPYDEMWPDDKLWYPKVFNNKYFDGYLKFEGISTLLEHNIIEKIPDN